MYYDLNVPWSHKDAELQRTISFLAELGYNVLALNHSITGALPKGDITCPIPATLPFALPPSIRVLRRLTLTVLDTKENLRLKELNDESSGYDILALRPTDEKTLSQVCHNSDCDIISLDLTIRYPFYFHYKTLLDAVQQGKRIELCYGPGLTSFDRNARKQLIENATAIIRATRGRGIIISSEASSALQCRAPADIVNVAAIWGLGQERGVEAVTKEARSVVVNARIKRTSYRGVIDVVYGGEKPPVTEKTERKEQGRKKRKAADMSVDPNDKDKSEQPMSKRQEKRIAWELKQKELAESKKAEAEKKREDKPMTDGELPKT